MAFEEVSGLNILYVTTVSSTMGFFPEHIKMLQREGHTVELACNLDKPLPEEIASLGCPRHHIPFSRSPFCKDNLSAYRALKKLFSENHYDIVHTHTPNASALVRLACRKLRRAGTKVFYTAHGFHFYTGAPLKNWLVYYPVERLLSRWTDVLITINQEDYTLAQKKMKAKRVVYVPGVGVDIDQFSKSNVSREEERTALKIPLNAIVITSVGELNANKNHIVIIRALSIINDKNILYLIAGEGEQRTLLQNEINDSGLQDQAILLGRRRDIVDLYNASDICAFPSIREGQGLAAIEGMAAGLPLLISDNRGTRGFIRDGENGIVCKYNDVSAFAEAIGFLARNEKIRADMGNKNRTLSKQFHIDIITSKMKEIYEDVRK